MSDKFAKLSDHLVDAFFEDHPELLERAADLIAQGKKPEDFMRVRWDEEIANITIDFLQEASPR